MGTCVAGIQRRENVFLSCLSLPDPGLKCLPFSGLSFPHCKCEVDKLTVPSVLTLAFMDREALLGSRLENGLLQDPGATCLAQDQLSMTGVLTAAELCLCLDDHDKWHVVGILRGRGCG